MRSQRQSAIAVGYFFALAGTLFGSWASRLADVKEALNASPGPLGAAMLCTAIGAITAMVLAPRLIRRFGSSSVVVAGGVGCCSFLLAAASAPSLLVLALALLGMGASSGMLAIGFGMQAVEFERRAGRPIVGRFHGCHSAGGLLGALLGAALSSWMSPRPHLIGVALAGLLGITLVARWLPADARPVHVRLAPTTLLNRRLFTISALAWSAAFGEGAVIGWAAVHLREEIGATSAVAALGFAAQAAAMVAVRTSSPAILSRWPVRSTLRLAGWTTAAGGALVALAPSPLVAIVGCALIGAGVALVFPTATARSDVSQLGAVRGPRLPSDAFAIAVLLGSTGALLSGPILGLVAEAAGTRTGFVVVALAGLAIAKLARRLPQAAPEMAPPIEAPAVGAEPRGDPVLASVGP